MSSERPTLRVVRVRAEGVLPRQMSEGAAGMDLSAAIAAPVRLVPGERVAVPTGLALAIPPGYEGQVRPRSGLARKSGVTVLNAPGTIDADYRGEVMVLLIHHGQEPVEIAPGERIAQLVIAKVERVVIEEVEQLESTARGDGGFGSTGRGTKGGG